MKRYYADMSDMRDAGGIADDEFVLSSDYADLEAERNALREWCGKVGSVNTELAKQLKAQDFALEHILDALDIDPEETHIDIKNGDSVVASVSIAELHSRAQAAIAAMEVKP